MANDDELLAKLERWLAGRPELPTIFDVIHTGDGELITAYVLKAFRSAARRAVVDRLEREQVIFPIDDAGIAGAVLRVFDGLARAWALTELEQLTLLAWRLVGAASVTRRFAGGLADGDY